MTVHGLLFDLDGTLVDTALGITAAINVVRCSRGGAPIGPSRVRPLVSLGVDVLLAHTLGQYACSPEVDRNLFRRHLSDHPASPSDIYPGVSAILEAFSGHYPMGLVTNKPEALASKLLSDLDLSHHFSIIVGGDSTPFAKPHRAPMDRAIVALGCAALETVMVGDSVVDAQAAIAASCEFALYEGGYGWKEGSAKLPPYSFKAFMELPALISLMSLGSGDHDR